jgi:hypothetical protein
MKFERKILLITLVSVPSAILHHFAAYNQKSQPCLLSIPPSQLSRLVFPLTDLAAGHLLHALMKTIILAVFILRSDTLNGNITTFACSLVLWTVA